jgi:hypothetical protein
MTLKTCAKCRKRSSCTEICSEIEKRLNRDTVSRKEITFTELERKMGLSQHKGMMHILKRSQTICVVIR